MGIEIFVYGPSRGVHTNAAFDYVIKELEDFLALNPESWEDVAGKLWKLGEEAAEGFPKLQ